MSESASAQRTIIDLLKRDHQVVTDLYAQIKAQADASERQKLANEFVRNLAVHDAIEAMVLYPAVQKKIDQADKQSQADAGLASSAMAEHRQVRQDLYNLDQMKVGDAGYDALLDKIMQEVKEHVHVEETVIFPRLEAALSVADLEKLGRHLEIARKTAPTRPHPSAPDTMPAIAIAGALAAPIDAARDQTREFRNSNLEGSP